MQIQHQHNSEQGAFFIEQNGSRIAELTYRTLGDNRLDAHHTFVDSRLRGQGIADELYRAFIAFVDQKGYQVRPSCSYIESKMRREKRI
ncbi:acetyltransferase [Chelonobacter oris]|uniref:Acetyltransferase n=1 Tax=Chelonobacter oris TaxID=505317 RepID=A0A0A3AKK6_9PAST|nr:GNAT family N-acetyltransferase [Chelonobacter oris]KGQ69861.1 acetyltransferase [Chelonobacter oris]